MSTFWLLILSIREPSVNQVALLSVWRPKAPELDFGYRMVPTRFVTRSPRHWPKLKSAVQSGPRAPAFQPWVSNYRSSRSLCAVWAIDLTCPLLGVHYWYDNRLDTSCDTFFPAFLMYNKGKLSGFGWDTVGKYDFTKRTEFPPYAALSVSLSAISLWIEWTASNLSSRSWYRCPLACRNSLNKLVASLPCISISLDHRYPCSADCFVYSHSLLCPAIFSNVVLIEEGR